MCRAGRGWGGSGKPRGKNASNSSHLLGMAFWGVVFALRIQSAAYRTRLSHSARSVFRTGKMADKQQEHFCKATDGVGTSLI